MSDRLALTRRRAGTLGAWSGLALAWALLVSTPALAQAPAPAPVGYTVAVVPQFAAAEVHRVWTPLLERVSRDTGVALTLKVAKDIPGFEADVWAGGPDFAYMNPYHQVLARRAQGYVPLVRDATLLTGILVVRKDSPVTTVQALQGQTLAFPAPNAFGASLWIRAHLTEQDKVAFTPFYARTHTNAYRQVLMGKAAAAGGVRATLDKEPPEVRDTLRVLFETPGAAPHPLSAHPRVPVAVRDAVARAFIRLAQDPALQPLLDDIPMARPVAADHARDYQPLERLRVDRFVE